MQELQQHTQEISRFAQEIKEISEQTNRCRSMPPSKRHGPARPAAALPWSPTRCASWPPGPRNDLQDRGLVGKLGDAASQSTAAVAATAARPTRYATGAATETAIQKIETICARSAQAA
jgi:methyl-accepting chemotaxis protein